MLYLLFASLTLAHAAEHRVGAAVGGHASVGLKTRLPVRGVEGGLVYNRQGDRGGFLVEVQDIYAVGASGPYHLPGLRAGWSRVYSDRLLRPYSVLGGGLYLNELLPVLPVLWAEGGVEVNGDALNLRLGPQLHALPPFFVGTGVRVAVTYQL